MKTVTLTHPGIRIFSEEWTGLVLEDIRTQKLICRKYLRKQKALKQIRKAFKKGYEF